MGDAGALLKEVAGFAAQAEGGGVPAGCAVWGALPAGEGAVGGD